MHVGFLAQESATVASAMSLVFAAIILFAWLLGFRAWWMLFGAGGLLGLCVYWGMLAVSAGPAPVVSRADIALWVRVVLLVAFLLLTVAFGLIAGRLWRWGKI
jgi:hypothetical protein